MRKCLTVLPVFLVFANIIIAQPAAQLMIKGYGKDIHLDHKVAPKEGIFSIGRLYNVHPKAIAAYNKIDISKGLSLGQVIHIPLTDTNFSQKNSKGTPVYYNVGEKETLEKVSNVNNKVALQKLRDWNKLSKDDLKAGKKLVIGFLVTNEGTVATQPPAEKKEVVTKEITDKPLVNTNKEEEKPIAKIEVKQDEEKPVVKPETKKEEPQIVTKPQVTTDMTGQGYFKSSFDLQVKGTPVSKTETVTSGVFRMVNGPQEAKFYLLADGIASGTVVRVINPENNKAVYAKVLGEMNGIRQNQGLNIRISNAAASTLGITDTDKFIVKINY
jgi:LysM repeat protein